MTMTKLTKAQMSSELTKTSAELEAAKELLAAIAAAADLPMPNDDDGDATWKLTMMDRLIAIVVHAKHTDEGVIGFRVGRDRLYLLADKPLGYTPYAERGDCDICQTTAGCRCNSDNR